MRAMNTRQPVKPLVPSPPQRVAAAALLGDRRELVIEHAGERYRLSLTRNGKLILTK